MQTWLYCKQLDLRSSWKTKFWFINCVCVWVSVCRSQRGYFVVPPATRRSSPAYTSSWRSRIPCPRKRIFQVLQELTSCALSQRADNDVECVLVTGCVSAFWTGRLGITLPYTFSDFIIKEHSRVITVCILLTAFQNVHHWGVSTGCVPRICVSLFFQLSRRFTCYVTNKFYSSTFSSQLYFERSLPWLFVRTQSYSCCIEADGSRKLRERGWL